MKHFAVVFLHGKKGVRLAHGQFGGPDHVESARECAERVMREQLKVPNLALAYLGAKFFAESCLYFFEGMDA